MRHLASLSLATGLLALAACAANPAGEPSAASANVPAAAAPQVAASPDARLKALFTRSDEDELRRNPLSALFRGDLRYADRLGDYLTPAYTDAERAAATAELAELRAIDRGQLNATDRIAYDVFEYTKTEQLADLKPEYLALTEVRPINHFFGFHTFYPTLSSGKGAAPFKTVADYDNALKRHADFARLMDRSIAKFREGMASGVLETRLTIDNVIAQLDAQLKEPVEDSQYYLPVKTFPADFNAADQARLTTDYRTAITGEIRPALTRLRDFLRDEYRPLARTSVGLGQMKGGPALYERLIESTTTLPLKADDIHRLGLSEVDRIGGEMRKVMAEVGFTGTLPQFFEFIRTSPKFQPKSRAALTQDYYDVGKRVDAKLPMDFAVLPKTKLEIRPYEEFREKYEAGGSYQSGTPDGSRAGLFYFNAYDLPKRATVEQTALYMHEGAPGHHFQISLAQENAALPPFMRFGGNTAYVEGWALYAETLGYEMGLYDDPYQRFGQLNNEMFRAIRLVVDTGLHSKGWSREKAIDYMLANSSKSRTDATAEVERYIAIPSQALAYKIGQLKIQELRAKAERALGDRFDVRAFHDQVLNTGALPLPILEKKIDDWIASQKS